MLAALAITFVAAAAHAQSDEATRRADALFEEGRTLVEARRFAEACPKFEESQRLDPGLGTLLNLAACYEETGKLASAWTAFRSAEEQARAAGEKKREQIAAERARALEARAARLTITLAPGERPPGFAVTRDGAPVAALDFGRRLPVDPGLIVIEATAPGHRPFRIEVEVSGEKVAREVDIPLLEVGEAPAAGGGDVTLPGGSGGGAGGPIDAPGGERRPRRKVALIVGGVGAAGVIAGVGLGLSARSAYHDVGCTAGDGPPRGCSADEESDIASARSRGNLGTIIGGVGVAALAAGAVLWLTAPVEGVAIAPAVGAGGASVSLRGRF